MSGYDSISDYAFNKFDIEKYNDYEIWLNDLENDFLENGRAPLDEIFDDQDYIDLENEWNRRKQIDVSEKLEDLKEEEEIKEEIEEIEEREIKKEIQKERRKERRKEIKEKEEIVFEKFVSINERWEKEIEKLVKDLPPKTRKKLLTKLKNKISGLFKGLFKR